MIRLDGGQDRTAPHHRPRLACGDLLCALALVLFLALAAEALWLACDAVGRLGWR
jgi:hypothetical protein